MLRGDRMTSTEPLAEPPTTPHTGSTHPHSASAPTGGTAGGPTTPEATSQARRKAFVGATVGHLIEWYDYGIYGFLAVYVGANFFISDDPLVGILSAFAVFALSFFIRPLGGLFFGPLADKIGRRNTLLIVLTMMCSATMLIGLLPTAHTIGVVAPILLVFLRLVQGFSAGGEISTITAFISEYSTKYTRGTATSLLMVTAALGLLTGAVVGNGLSWILGTETMTEWGWRIPFIIAGPLGAVAIFIRMRLEDSPEFKTLQKENRLSKAPLRDALRYPRQLLLVAAVITLLASSFYLVMTYLTTHLNTILGLSWGGTFTYVLLAGVIGMVLMPVGGRITDRLGRRRNYLLVTSVFLAAAAGWFFWSAPNAETPLGLLPSLIALAVGFGLYCGVPYATMSELLPTHVRSTGIALGYNIPVAVFGGSAPFIASWLIQSTGDVASPGLFFIFTAAVSFVGTLFLREQDLLGKEKVQAHSEATARSVTEEISEKAER